MESGDGSTSGGSRGRGYSRGRSNNYRGRGGGGHNVWKRGSWRARGGGNRWNGRGRGRGSGRGRGGVETPPPPPSSSLHESRTSQGWSPGGGSFPSSPLVIENEPFVASNCPFPAWRSYLPRENYSENCPHIHKIKVVQKYLARLIQDFSDLDEILETRKFSVDLKALFEDSDISKNWPDLKDELFGEYPETVLGIIGLAKHQNALNEISSSRNNSVIRNEGLDDIKFPVVRPRLNFDTYQNLMPLKDLKSSYFGQIVTLKGTVVRVSNIRPLCIWMSFQCCTCQNVQTVHQPDGKYAVPNKCLSTGCRAKSFNALRSHKQTKTVDWQKLKLQEIIQHESGRVPRTIEIEVTEDLCDIACPGDIVTLSGIVKTVADSSSNSWGKRNDDRSMFSLYLRGINMINHKSKKGVLDGNRSSNLGFEFSFMDQCLVEEIKSLGKDLFKTIVHSLCPSIYGHELVKAGLILGLFGGTNKYGNNSKSHMSVRGDPHVLIVGDPGLGKSQMLNSCASVAPRGVFVTGNTTTSSGLTVTLSKESGSDFSLEAGALVLADQGHCCIDEFDKMSNQHQALLEAMEQQAISIAKAGVVCSLPARTAVLAAANPIGGHYNRGKTVSENLKMSPALLSRFDVVFILIDKPNETLDSLLTDHILNLHQNNKTTTKKPGKRISNSQSILEPGIDKNSSSLLKVLRENIVDLDLIPLELLQKYIAYTRRSIFPKLLPEACSVLQEFYLELRRKKSYESTPITLRQLESLIRLTEARAKCECREEANKEDALDVIEIMKSSMVDVYLDQDGQLDFTRSQNGAGMSKRASAKKFISVMNRKAQEIGKNIFSTNELKEYAVQAGISTDNFYEFIDSLNIQGYLLKKSSKTYQLATVD